MIIVLLLNVRPVLLAACVSRLAAAQVCPFLLPGKFDDFLLDESSLFHSEISLNKLSIFRFVMMEQYNLGIDEGDARLIHCNNCLQLCVCIARIVDCIVDTPATECCETTLEIVSCVMYQCIQGTN